ncbi:MAG: hypothetical protein JST80_04550 [Bdellovibrionales bacterium]|nr:hypothetical protein [Bdellovibrionales bacterium]
MNTTSMVGVGKEIVCFCTRCKMDLGHTIMSMVGGSPSRVVCRTCKSEHNYKPKRGVTEPGGAGTVSRSSTATRAPRERTVEKTVPVEVEWMNQMNASTKPMKEYGADQVFMAGDRVKHPTFGDGVVQKLLYPNKIEVLFRMDLKTLIHSGKA